MIHDRTSWHRLIYVATTRNWIRLDCCCLLLLQRHPTLNSIVLSIITRYTFTAKLTCMPSLVEDFPYHLLRSNYYYYLTEAINFIYGFHFGQNGFGFDIVNYNCVSKIVCFWYY